MNPINPLEEQELELIDTMSSSVCPFQKLFTLRNTQSPLAKEILRKNQKNKESPAQKVGKKMLL